VVAVSLCPPAARASLCPPRRPACAWSQLTRGTRTHTSDTRREAPAPGSQGCKLSSTAPPHGRGTAAHRVQVAARDLRALRAHAVAVGAAAAAAAAPAATSSASAAPAAAAKEAAVAAAAVNDEVQPEQRCVDGHVAYNLVPSAAAAAAALLRSAKLCSCRSSCSTTTVRLRLARAQQRR